MQKLKKKYGLLSAICMVIGSVIGSGVFFKAQHITRMTDMDALIGCTAWIIGGVIMLLCLFVFSLFSKNYIDASGVADYAEALVSRRYGYYVGWFMAMIYCPSLVSVLSYLCARYTLLSLGVSEDGNGLCILLCSVFLALSYCQNVLFPSFSGKLQIITTFVKLIPLVLMIIFGTLSGISTKVLSENFSVRNLSDPFGSLFSAVVSCAFAYEGWIGALSIGAELKNSKKNLPRALLIGGSIVAAVYLFYFTGIQGAVKSEILANYPYEGVMIAFDNILGKGFAATLTSFIAVSCFGALNATMFCAVRAMYTIAKKGQGPFPKLFSQIDSHTRIPSSSGAAALAVSMAWLFFYYGANVSPFSFFARYGFDSSELPIVSIYALYIPMFVMFIKNSSDNFFKRFLIVPLAIIACLFMVFCAACAHGRDLINYLAVFIAIMLFGAVFEKK